MGVLTLAAGKGSVVVVVCEGVDAAEALAALAKVFESGFGER
jgi:phosphocarrier protein